MWQSVRGSGKKQLHSQLKFYPVKKPPELKKSIEADMETADRTAVFQLAEKVWRAVKMTTD